MLTDPTTIIAAAAITSAGFFIASNTITRLHINPFDGPPHLPDYTSAEPVIFPPKPNECLIPAITLYRQEVRPFTAVSYLRTGAIERGRPGRKTAPFLKTVALDWGGLTTAVSTRAAPAVLSARNIGRAWTTRQRALPTVTPLAGIKCPNARCGRRKLPMKQNVNFTSSWNNSRIGSVMLTLEQNLAVQGLEIAS